MKKTILLLIIVFVLVISNYSAKAESIVQLYDVNFSSPLHTVGQLPTIGTGPPPRQTPTRITGGTPTVVEALGALTDQPLRFNSKLYGSGYVYDKLEFDLYMYEFNSPFDELFPRYLIEMDVLIESPGEGFRVFVETPQIRRIDFKPDETVSVYVPDGSNETIGTYSLGAPSALRIELDLEEKWWSVSINGSRLYAGPFLTDEFKSLDLYDNVYCLAVVDNINVYGLRDSAALLSLNLTGPKQVPVNSLSQYTATSLYEVGRTKDVTGSTIWLVEPEDFANIDKNGLLTTNYTDTPQDITIYATYTEGDVTVEAQMAVEILPPRTLLVPSDFNTIQDAIDIAIDGDTVVVADGTYTGPGNRDIDFLGKAITVKSENGPENCIIDCNGTEDNPHRGFNFLNGENENSILDGFTITNGYAPEERFVSSHGVIFYRAFGGGIFCYHGSPTITNCIINYNSARNGGGIYCERSFSKIRNCIICYNQADAGVGIFGRDSDLTIENCNISNNTLLLQFDMGGGIKVMGSSCLINNCTISGNSGAMYGGGICCIFSDECIITNCVISGNLAYAGGGIYCEILVNLNINNCNICNNTAELRGGGIFCRDNTAAIINNTVTGNISYDDAGGIYCRKITADIFNCTFADNSSSTGNALVCYSRNNLTPSDLRLTNCILWDGGDEIYNYDNSTITLKYCDIQGSWLNEGNIDIDPQFVDPCNNDYHLLPSSPCIDTGDPYYVPVPNETDLDGNPRVINSRIDMGAYEFVPMIEVRMKMTPQTLNPKSKGRWLKAHLVLPEGFTTDDVDADTPAVIEPFGIESDYIDVFINEDGFVEIEAAFSRTAFCSVATSDKPVEVTVTGLLTSGRQFYGTDFIKITYRRQPRQWQLLKKK